MGVNSLPKTVTQQCRDCNPARLPLGYRAAPIGLGSLVLVDSGRARFLGRRSSKRQSQLVEGDAA